MADPATVSLAIDRALAAATHDASAIELWSGLAEGADRLAAHGVLRIGGCLVAVLPFEPSEYESDFATTASIEEFRRLLACADRVIVTGAGDDGSRESAYERVGEALVDRCDTLLAVWDGRAAVGRGGTADVVQAARARGRTVIVIDGAAGEGMIVGMRIDRPRDDDRSTMIGDR